MYRLETRIREDGKSIIVDIIQLNDVTQDDIHGNSHDNIIYLNIDKLEYPPAIKGKELCLIWDNDNNKIIPEYTTLPYDRLTLVEQNALLRDELDLTQAALFELHKLIKGES